MKPESIASYTLSCRAILAVSAVAPLQAAPPSSRLSRVCQELGVRRRQLEEKRAGCRVSWIDRKGARSTKLEEGQRHHYQLPRPATPLTSTTGRRRLRATRLRRLVLWPSAPCVQRDGRIERLRVKFHPALPPCCASARCFSTARPAFGGPATQRSGECYWIQTKLPGYCPAAAAS